MRFLAELCRRLRYLFNRSRLERELEQELDVHRRMMGEPARFGNALRLREESRDIWGWNWLDDLWHDLRYGVRQLYKAPAFAALSLITLAIGIGANTGLFSVLNAVFLDEPPVRNPGLLRQIEWSDRIQPGIANSGIADYSYPVFEYFRRRSSTFSDILCLKYRVGVSLRIQGNVERATADFVSANFFQALGGRQIQGRLLTPTDDEPGATPVAVLNEAAWQRFFAGNTAAIGQTLTVNGIPFVIAGIVPQDFDITTRRDTPILKLPISQYAAVARNPTALTSDKEAPCRLIGIQRPEASSEQTQMESERLVREAFSAYAPTLPNKGTGQSETIVSNSVRVGVRRIGRGIDDITLRDIRRELPAVLSVMLLPWAILLIPCCNIAGMLLARASARRGEIATRLSMGAGRRRVIRQLLTESIVLASLGGLLGALLCFLVNRFALVFEIPFALDVRVLAFTAGLSITTGLLFGLVPALNATQMDLISVTKQESASVQGRSNRRIGKSLVACQVALSFVLLIMAGLQVRSLLSLPDTTIADPERVLMLGIDGRSAEYSNEQLRYFLLEGTGRLERMPGVASVSIASMGLGFSRTAEFSLLQMNVGPAFFSTMNIPILAGRDLQWTDGAAGVAVVNEAFARKYYAGTNPLGQSAQGYGQIVGVVRNSSSTLASGMARGAGIEPTVYLPIAQKTRMFWLLVRTTGEPGALISPIRRVLSDVDSQIPVGDAQTLADEVAFLVRERRTIAGVFLSVGLIALLQAACGIYGTLSYFVSRRTPEIGLRMALGAERKDVVRMVIRQSMGPILFGILLGLFGAPLITFAMQSNGDLLIGRVTMLDQVIMIASVSFLVAAAIAAAWAPAWHAARIDPMQALRHE